MARFFAGILILGIAVLAMIGEPTAQADVAVTDWEEQFANVDTRLGDDDISKRSPIKKSQATEPNASTLGNTTVTLQDGVSGYLGTSDTYIYNVSPTTPRGPENLIIQDKNPSNVPEDERTSLLRFDLSSIPTNVTIVSAQLDFYVDSEGQGFDMYRMKVPWNEATASFASIGNRHFIAEGIDAEIAIDAAWPGVDGYVGPITVTVPASTISDWVNGVMTNNGWLMVSAHNDDGVQLRSSEHATVANRPKLTVVYNETPPNNAPAQPVAIAPLDDATDVSTSPDLEVSVTDPDAGNLTVNYYGRPVATPSKGEDFTIIAMPDTQHYVDNGGANAANFYAQTQWLVANKDTLNIRFVTGLGDIVENGNTFDSEWQIANNAYSTIENPLTTNLPDGMPFGLAVGNHDQTPNGGGDTASTTKYNQYFGSSRFTGRGYYGGHYGSDNDNHYQLFSGGGMDFIIIHLEYDTTPLPAVLAWADGLLQTYSNRRAIVTTHWMLGMGMPAPFGAQGAAIYNELKDRPNLFLLLGGHVHAEGRRQDTFEGRTVHGILSDYQSRPNGGNGLLRIMTFSPVNNTISVQTYSPSLGQFENDFDSTFTLSYDMSGSAPFQAIGTNTSVPSGTNTSINWPGLTTNTEYEWYATVSDGTDTTTGPVWSFTTSSVGATPTNTLTSTPTNTPTPTVPPSISGTITYGNAINNPPAPRFVNNVSVASTVGSPAVGPVLTGTPGSYVLTGFGLGSYTIKPTKQGGANTAITSNDAARIAQGVSGALLFVSQNQRFAADVSGNGAVSSADAAKIAQYSVGLPTAPPNFSGDWNFFVTGAPSPLPTPPQTYDDSRTYASVTSGLTGEDFVGILVGEVSGNWNPAILPRAAEPVVVAQGPEISDNSTETEKPITVTAQHVVTADNEVVIPVNVQNVVGKEIISYEFDLRYDPAVMQPLARPVDVTGTVSRGLFVVTNPYEPGLLRVVVYGPMPIDEDGVLLNLKFTIVGTPGSASPLTWTRIMFNEGSPLMEPTDGQVEISSSVNSLTD